MTSIGNTLVTGGAGFVGRHVARVLAESNIKVIIADNLSNSSTRRSVEFLSEFRGLDQKLVTFYNADIRDSKAIERIFEESKQIRTCIHLAAKVSVADSIRNPGETFDVNVRGTQNMLNASCKYGIKNFIFASSAAVYGNPSILPISEDHVADPISPYGSSKLKGEKLAISFRNKLENIVILRFFNIYGKGQNLEYAGVISRFAECLLNEIPPIIYGTGKQSRDFISVRDVVRSILLACQPEKTQEGTQSIYNIGTGIETKIVEVAKILAIVTGRKQITPSYHPARSGDILRSYADVGKAERELRFIPQDILEVALNYLYGHIHSH